MIDSTHSCRGNLASFWNGPGTLEYCASLHRLEARASRPRAAMRPITGARASCPRLPHEGISRGGFLEETSSFLHSHTLLPLIFPTSRVEHFSGARGVCHIPNRAPHTATEMMEIENLFRYTALAAGLMKIKNESSAKSRNFTNPMPGVEAAGGPGIAMAAPESP